MSSTDDLQTITDVLRHYGYIPHITLRNNCVTDELTEKEDRRIVIEVRGDLISTVSTNNGTSDFHWTSDGDGNGQPIEVDDMIFILEGALGCELVKGEGGELDGVTTYVKGGELM